MEYAAAIAQLRAHEQLGFTAFGRAMQHVHAKQPGERGQVGDGHCCSSVAVDVLIAQVREVPASRWIDFASSAPSRLFVARA
jgi:hypothetical protein